MATAANLTEDEVLKIDKVGMAELLAIPEQDRNSVISRVKCMVGHEAYKNAKYVRVNLLL